MCEHNLNQWSSRIQRQCGSIIGRFIINVLHRRQRSGANRWARRWSPYFIIIIIINIMIVIIIIIILIIIVMMNWALFGSSGLRDGPYDILHKGFHELIIIDRQQWLQMIIISTNQLMITFEGSKGELSEHYEHRLHSHNQVQYFSCGGLFERGV